MHFQDEFKAAAFSDRGIDMDYGSVGFDNSPCERQSQSGSAYFSGGAPIELVEGFKDLFQAIVWDSNAGVTDLDMDEVILAACLQDDHTP